MFRCFDNELNGKFREDYKTAALPLSYASLRGISPTYVRDVNRRGWHCAKIVSGVSQESARGVLLVRFAHNCILLIDVLAPSLACSIFLTVERLKPRCSMLTEPTCSQA